MKLIITRDYEEMSRRQRISLSVIWYKNRIWFWERQEVPRNCIKNSLRLIEGTIDFSNVDL